MSDVEQERIEPLRYQLKKWNAVANKHLLPTMSDRDNAAAIDKLIQSLQAERDKLREALEDIANYHRAGLTGDDAHTIIDDAQQALGGSYGE